MSRRLLALFLVLPTLMQFCAVPALAAEKDADLPELPETEFAPEEPAETEELAAEAPMQDVAVYASGDIESATTPFTYRMLTDTTISIAAYRGTDAAVIVPETIDGFTVTALANYAFRGNTALTSVTLADTISAINYRAFYNCTSLSSVNIPKSWTTAGIEIFRGCKALTSVTVPEGMMALPDSAFYGANGLQSVTLPATLTKLGTSVFKECTALQSIEIPSGVTEIPNSAFSGCTALTSVTLPDTVTSINYRAFYNCQSLETVDMRGGEIRKIGSKAFYNCAALKTFNVTLSPTAEITSDAFDQCTISGSCGENLTWTVNLQTKTLNISGNGALTVPEGAGWGSIAATICWVNLPDGLTEIANGAFANFTSLKSFTIPSSVMKIGVRAFAGCRSLQRVELPERLTELGADAFDGCTALETAIFCGDPPINGVGGLPAGGAVTVYYPKTSGLWPVTAMGDTTSRRYDTWDDTLPLRDVLLVLDCSGSMSGSRMAGLKTAVNTFVERTGGRLTNTRLGVVSFTDSAMTRLRFTSDTVQAKEIVSALPATGGTRYTQALTAAGTLLDDSTADIKSVIFFSDGEPNDGTGDIYTVAAGLRGKGYFLYTVGLCTAGSNAEQILINVAGSRSNYFLASDIDSLTNLFLQLNDNIGKKNGTKAVMERGGQSYDLLTEEQMFEAGSSETVNILITPYWDGAVPGKVQITQNGKAVMSSEDGRFEDVVPAKIFHPVASVLATLVDADGKVVAAKKLRITVEPDEQSRFQIDTKETTFTVYQNKRSSSQSSDKYVLSEGATITYNGKQYQTDKDGTAQLPPVRSGSVTVSKTGFVSRTISFERLSSAPKIYLQPVSDGAPVVSAVWIGDIDVLNESYPAGMTSTQAVQLEAEVIWGAGGAGTLTLEQDARAVKFSGTRLTTVLRDNFDTSQKIYIHAVGADGRSSKKALKFSASEASGIANGLNQLSLKIGNDISLTIPDAAPSFMAGEKLKFGVDIPVPVSVTVENGKVYAAIGLDLINYSYKKAGGGTGTSEVKWFCQQFKDVFKGAANSKKDVQSLFRDYRKFIKKQKTNFGVKTDLTVMGYGEGYLDSQGKVVWVDHGVILNPSGSVGKTYPFSVPVGPIVLPMFAEWSISLDILAKLNLHINDQFEQVTPFGDIKGELKPSGGVGLGVNKAASVSGGLDGKLEALWKIYPDAKDYLKLTASLNFYLKVQAAFFEYKHPFDPIYDQVWYETPAQTATMASAASIYDTGNYTPADLSYLTQEADLSPMSEIGQDDCTVQTLRSNIYQNAAPQYADFGGGCALAVWVDGTDSDVNTLRLRYSYCDGSSWSEPAEVYADGTMDAMPQLRVFGGSAYLTWQNASKAFTGSETLDRIAPYFDIAVAKFTPGSGFTTAVIEDPGLDMLPALADTGSGAAVAWVHNEENAWFGDNAANSIRYALFDGTSCTAPATRYTGLNAISALAADWNRSIQLAYAMDADGDLATDDSVLCCNGARVTEGTLPEYCPVYSGHTLYWLCGGQICTADAALPAADAGYDYQILMCGEVPAAVYTQADGMGSELAVSFYNDDTGAWEEPYTLGDGSSLVQSFSAAFTADGTLRVLASVRPVVDAAGKEPYGAASLLLYTVQPGSAAELLDADYDAARLSAGAELPVTFTLANRGFTAIESYTAAITDASGATLASAELADMLVPGQAREGAVCLTVTEAMFGSTVTLTVTPKGGTPLHQSITLRFEDVGLENARWGETERGSYVLLAELVNRGCSARTGMTVSLRQGAADGAVLDSCTVASLAPLESAHIRFERTEGEGVFYLTVENSGDSFTINDSDYLCLTDGDPKPIRIAGMTGSTVRVSLGSGMSGTCCAAVYDAAGRLLTAGAKRVSTPGAVVDVSLDRPLLTPGCTVRVYLLDETCAPLCEAVTTVYTG